MPSHSGPTFGDGDRVLVSTRPRQRADARTTGTFRRVRVTLNLSASHRPTASHLRAALGGVLGVDVGHRRPRWNRIGRAGPSCARDSFGSRRSNGLGQPRSGPDERSGERVVVGLPAHHPGQRVHADHPAVSGQSDVPRRLLHRSAVPGLGERQSIARRDGVRWHGFGTVRGAPGQQPASVGVFGIQPVFDPRVRERRAADSARNLAGGACGDPDQLRTVASGLSQHRRFRRANRRIGHVGRSVLFVGGAHLSGVGSGGRRLHRDLQHHRTRELPGGLGRHWSHRVAGHRGRVVPSSRPSRLLVRSGGRQRDGGGVQHDRPVHGPTHREPGFVAAFGGATGHQHLHRDVRSRS